MNIAALLEEQLSPRALEVLAAARGLANRANTPAYLVGGVVRDVFLGRPTWDLDIVLEGNAEQFAAELAAAVGGKITGHSQFGTFQTVCDGLNIDVVMARREHYPRPGALPQVAPGTLEQDLARRDFTIHAMAVVLSGDGWGELIDPHGGRDDLSGKLIRFLHDKSFQDDPTRLLRAVRYAARLGFALERATEAALVRDAVFLERVSGARRWKELERLLREPEPEAGLMWAQKPRLLRYVHPPLGMSERHAKAFAEARTTALPRGVEPLVYLCILAYRLTDGERHGLIDGLRLPRREARALTELGDVLALAPRLSAADVRPSEAVALLKDRSVAVVQTVELMTEEERIRERLHSYLTNWRLLRPRLKATELEALGVPHGPAVGHCLQALRNARVDEVTSSVEDERAFVRRWLGSERP